MEDWLSCKNLLCIRADNIGDLLMSTPAIAALKTTIGCKITVLTSSKAATVTPMIPDIDEVIAADLPWVKLDTLAGPEMLQELITRLRSYAFDGCVIFSVYSQNPLPAAMLAYLSGIPLRLAYCRENPYHLLTAWLPDKEPYGYIRHQVERDLELVGSIGAVTQDPKLRLKLNPASWETAKQQIRHHTSADLSKPYLLLHPGVSEEKRKYPEELWITAGKLLIKEFGVQLLISGSPAEKTLAERICKGIGDFSWSVAGLLSLEEFAMVIRQSQAVIAVNTATIHLASAVNKSMVVLYAQSNPQHTPWHVPHKLLEYSIPQQLSSKNQVIAYVNGKYYTEYLEPPSARVIAAALKDLLETEK